MIGAWSSGGGGFGGITVIATVVTAPPGLAMAISQLPGATFGSLKATWFPMAEVMAAGVPQALTLTLVAPKPWPLTVIRSPGWAEVGVTEITSARASTGRGDAAAAHAAMAATAIASALALTRDSAAILRAASNAVNGT